MKTGQRWSRRELARRAAAFVAEKPNAVLVAYATLAVATFVLTLVTLAVLLNVAGDWAEFARAFPVHR